MDFQAPGNSALSPVSPPATAIPSAYADRSTGLIIFGILEIIAGALAALAIPFALLGAVMARRTGAGMPRGNAAASVLVYAIACGVLLTLGIGAIQAKRWARALNLILSWIWLILGALMTIALTIVLPRVMRPALLQASQRSSGSPDISTGAMAVVLTLTIAFMAVFLIVVPVAFLLFYRSPNVEETCRHRDPVERWTDRLPLPILAYGLLAALAALYMAVLSFSTPIFPMFGRYLTGVAGGSAMLVFAVIDVYIAYSFFRLNVKGWWVALASLGLRIISTAITYARADLFDAYRRLGWSPAQVDMLRNNPAFQAGRFLWISLLFTVLYAGFLIWTKRYFPQVGPADASFLDASQTPTQQSGS